MGSFEVYSASFEELTQNANVIKLNHNQFKNLDRFTHVQLEVTVETNGEKHINAITEALREQGYEIQRLY